MIRLGLGFGIGGAIGYQAWRDAPRFPEPVPQVLAIMILLACFLCWSAGRARGRGASATAVASAVAVSEVDVDARSQVAVQIVVADGARAVASRERGSLDSLPWLEATHGNGWDRESLAALCEEQIGPDALEDLREAEGCGVGADEVVSPAPLPLAVLIPFPPHRSPGR